MSILKRKKLDKRSAEIENYALPVRFGPEMRVLIIGGGIAGLTLAGLLQQRGFKPRIVERIPEYGKVGYIIVLWPSGSRVLKGLGLYRDLVETGLPFSTYNVWDEKGEMLKSYSVDEVSEKYGPMIKHIQVRAYKHPQEKHKSRKYNDGPLRREDPPKRRTKP